MAAVEFETIEEEKSLYKTIFSWKKTDNYLIAAICGTTLLIWLILLFTKSFGSILTYGDGPSIIYVGRRLYSEPQEDFMLKSGSQMQNASNQDIFGTPIGTPLLVSALHYATLGFWTPAAMIYILITNSICILLFERFLSSWNIVQNPVLTASLLSVFPIRFLSSHSTLSSDTIYLSCVFVALIGYKFHNESIIFYSTVVASLFDRQAFALAFSLFISFFKMSQYGKSFKMLFALLIGYTSISVLQLICAGKPFAFLSRVFFNAPDFQLAPFVYFFANGLSIATMESFHISWMLFAASAIGILMISRYSFMLVSFPIASMLYAACFICNDINRYTYALEIFGVLIGFDLFITSVRFKKALPAFAILYGIGGIVFAYNNIRYSAMYQPDYFWDNL